MNRTEFIVEKKERKETMEKSWAYCSRKRLQNIINMTLDFLYIMRERIEKHWIKAFCDANLCTYTMSKTFHSVFFPARKIYLFNFYAFFMRFLWDHFIFSMMFEKPFATAAAGSAIYLPRPKRFHSIFKLFNEEKRKLRKIDFQVVFVEFLIASHFQLRTFPIRAFEELSEK